MEEGDKEARIWISRQTGEEEARDMGRAQFSRVFGFPTVERRGK